MDSQPPLPGGDYWYLGSSDPAIDQLFRRACALAWPYALYCATRYQRDPHLAYEFMDEAVENAERYYERFNGRRNAVQLSFRIISVIKRLSKQRAEGIKEIASGTLSELDKLVQRHATRPDVEQDAYVRQLLDQMTDRTRRIAYWRLAGHSWRQIAEELGEPRITLWRATNQEIRGLLHLPSDTYTSDERGESD
jgi:hypothetical protein